jgi:endo-1,4-beta-mannosidase
MRHAVAIAMIVCFAVLAFTAIFQQIVAGADVPERWPAEKAWQWYKQQPWLCGFNYIPATAINYTEMWQKETFDPKTIDEELALAEQVRFNSLRCVLQYPVWEHDPDGFKQRMDQFLAICHKHGIRVVFCLFDDCVFGPEHDPYPGKQADVVPGWYAHDWSPSPGWSRVKDPKTWPKLRQYVQDVLTRFKDDPRVLMWDLYNEPTNGIGDATLPLLTKIVDWARQVNPSQPLSVGVWNENRKLNDLVVNRFDVITFHRYSNASQLETIIRTLGKYGRPLVCPASLKENEDSTITGE